MGDVGDYWNEHRDHERRRKMKMSEDESDESAMWKQYREKKREQKI